MVHQEGLLLLLLLLMSRRLLLRQKVEFLVGKGSRHLVLSFDTKKEILAEVQGLKMDQGTTTMKVEQVLHAGLHGNLC